MSRRPGDHHLLGSVYDRRRRVEWIIETFGIPRKSDGCKTRIACAHCHRVLMVVGSTGNRRWEIDRYPICGHDGGRYVRGNIVPACKPCNTTRCTRAKKCKRVAPEITKSRKVAHFIATFD